MVLTLTALVIFALAAIVAVILGYAARRWRFGTEQLRAKLDAARRPIATKTYGPSELIGLPEPVQRYFRAALRGGQQLVAAVNMEHRGTFNPSETGELPPNLAKREIEDLVFPFRCVAAFIQER